MRDVFRVPCALLLLAVLGLPASSASAQVRPRVRAITAFISIDARAYRAQIQEAVTFLTGVRAAVTAAGYQVQTIRISTQPFPQFTRGLSRVEALAVLRGIDGLGATLGFAPNIGPAMTLDSDDTAPVDLLIDVLATPGNRLNANLIVASDDGIHWRAVRQAARVIRQVGARSAHGQGNFNFAAIAMLKAYGPFYPGAWHPGGGPRTVAVGLESANVAMDVLARNRDPRTAGPALTDALTTHARAVERAVMRVASSAGWAYGGIDPTPAPGGAASIGAAIEAFTGQTFGSPGTETAAGMITRAVKKVSVKQTGYAGLMIPVLEESVLTERWTEGTYGLDAILAYSAVCAAGVDTVPLPGDTPESAIAAIIGDVATLAVTWNKPLAVRLLPSPGRQAGEMTEFSGQLSNAVIQPLPGARRR